MVSLKHLEMYTLWNSSDMWGRCKRKALNFENRTNSKNEKLPSAGLFPVGCLEKQSREMTGA